MITARTSGNSLCSNVNGLATRRVSIRNVSNPAISPIGVLTYTEEADFTLSDTMWLISVLYGLTPYWSIAPK